MAEFDLDKAEAALVSTKLGLVWVVEGRASWDRLMGERPSHPVFTAREALDLKNAPETLFRAIFWTKSVIPGSRLLPTEGFR